MNNDAINNVANASKKAKSHKEAERRRRERINGHLSTFRTLVPNGPKTDKASLLAGVVKKVKDLQELSAAVTSLEGSWDGYWPIPNEKDELVVEYYKDYPTSSIMMIRVSFSCEDRSNLLSDLIRVLRKTVQGKVVKAEMSTVGGRMKSVILVQLAHGKAEGIIKPKTTYARGVGRRNGGSTSIGDEVDTLRRALKPVINKPPAISPNNKWLYA